MRTPLCLLSLLLALGLTACGAQPAAAPAVETPTIMLIVRDIQPGLTEEEMTRRYRARMPDFRALDGLIQKYYSFDKKTGTYAGIYLWRDQAALDAYLDSDLKKTIASAYELKGPPTVERFEVIDLLR